jgi:hypothetical protein
LNPNGAAPADAQNNTDNKTTNTQSLAESRACDDVAARAGNNTATPSAHLPGTLLQSDYAQSRTEKLPYELADLLKVWPILPEPIKAGILAMVKAVRP